MTSPREECWDLPADLSAVSKVREMVGSALTDWGADTELIDDAVLIFGELCGNAFRHGTSPVTVKLRFSGQKIYGEVTDGGSTFVPRQRTVTAQDEGGRGLMIVEALADQWDVQACGGAGKTVWFFCSSPNLRAATNAPTRAWP
ncbi:ATP-binding protein [Sphaerisporangium aureirubrum]|uniref:ATP-binding protein n=2 Tax=Sphaerisporangium aureirubrum TaxID=1544736 RepID=A0ABW1NSN6_9ACTN